MARPIRVVQKGKFRIDFRFCILIFKIVLDLSVLKNVNTHQQGSSGPRADLHWILFSSSMAGEATFCKEIKWNAQKQDIHSFLQHYV